MKNSSYEKKKDILSSAVILSQQRSLNDDIISNFYFSIGFLWIRLNKLPNKIGGAFTEFSICEV